MRFSCRSAEAQHHFMLPGSPSMPTQSPNFQHRQHSTTSFLMALITLIRNNNAPKTNMHILPCKFSESTSADLKCHFNSSETMHFRGRKLLSDKLSLRDDYTGILGEKSTVDSYDTYHEEQGDMDELDTDDIAPSESHQIKVTHVIDSIHVWGHETKPSEKDPWMGVSELIELSHAIHDD